LHKFKYNINLINGSIKSEGEDTGGNAESGEVSEDDGLTERWCGRGRIEGEGGRWKRQGRPWACIK